LGHGPASVPLNAEAPSRVCVPNVAAAVVAALIDSVAAGRARNVNEPDADVGELDASPQAPWLRRGAEVMGLGYYDPNGRYHAPNEPPATSSPGDLPSTGPAISLSTHAGSGRNWSLPRRSPAGRLLCGRYCGSGRLETGAFRIAYFASIQPIAQHEIRSTEYETYKIRNALYSPSTSTPPRLPTSTDPRSSAANRRATRRSQ
jgi:hypothetical protein